MSMKGKAGSQIDLQEMVANQSQLLNQKILSFRDDWKAGKSNGFLR